MSTITLSHGSGGTQTNQLINDLFFKYFSNDILNQMNDAAQIEIDFKKLAFTTDSFVVNPLSFREEISVNWLFVERSMIWP